MPRRAATRDDAQRHAHAPQRATVRRICHDRWVKPWELIAETRTPAGERMTLMRHDREWMILSDDKPLMSSRMHGSEESLATLGCERLLAAPAPRVLVGGLGLGFTLAAALRLLPRKATVVVAELVPAVVDWNRGSLGELAGHPLADPRVRVDVADVLVTMRSAPATFDAVLLDVDNGPDAFTTPRNAALYGVHGLATIRAALKPGGVLAIWSAERDQEFERRLKDNGFIVRAERVRVREAKSGPRHTIFLGQVGPLPAKTARPRRVV